MPTLHVSDSYRVPFGRALEGDLVRPSQAVPTHSYACPECAAPLVLRSGSVRAAHFAHAAGTGCGESNQHRQAKAILVDLVNEGRRLSFNRPCQQCGRRHLHVAPEGVVSARAEYRLPNGRIVDVGLLDGDDRLVGAIEVFFSHALDDAKQADLEGLPWFELDAWEVLRRKPTPYNVLKDNLPPPDCNFVRPRLPALSVPSSSLAHSRRGHFMTDDERTARVNALTPGQIAAMAKSWDISVENLKAILFKTPRA